MMSLVLEQKLDASVILDINDYARIEKVNQCSVCSRVFNCGFKNF